LGIPGRPVILTGASTALTSAAIVSGSRPERIDAVGATKRLATINGDGKPLASDAVLEMKDIAAHVDNDWHAFFRCGVPGSLQLRHHVVGAPQSSARYVLEVHGLDNFDNMRTERGGRVPVSGFDARRHRDAHATHDPRRRRRDAHATHDPRRRRRDLRPRSRFSSG
jgi:hypothetical protein